MRIVHIKQKLEELQVATDGIVLGDFDMIGEFTAKRFRDRNDPNYKKFGAAYRSNYERGILVYFLIRQLNIKTMLEIGFGRGYATFCAAKAFDDAGVKGKIVTIDPNVNEEHVNALQRVFPSSWFKHVNLIKGLSQDVIPKLNEQFGLVYINGDHSMDATKRDWELTNVKCTHATLFDDYHLPSKDDPGIHCRDAIDQIDWKSSGFQEPELIKLDRRIFVDERRYTDEQVDYGQVLALKEGVGIPEW
jgi:hypothetical protein